MAEKLFAEKSPVRMCAPMVRYSKLPFRLLVRRYGCDMAFTPMIVSDSFINSNAARDVELTMAKDDRPLIVQFAARDPNSFGLAVALVKEYVDGVDLNCGCPQRWALEKCYGSYLITQPQLIADMIKHGSFLGSLPISIKIRIHEDLRKTVELVKRAEVAGASWITVHGRTVKQRTEPCNFEAIKTVKESVSIPVVANGDIFSNEDVKKVIESTHVDGVMSARGILQNPAMYQGYSSTPLKCVHDWVKISLECGVTFTSFHHHLMFMLENVITRTDKRVFNNLSNMPSVLDYLERFNYK